MTKVHYTCVCGRKLKKKEMLAMKREKQKRELEGLTTKHSLMKNHILTKAQITHSIQTKVLVPIVYQGRSYFSQSDVIKAVQRLIPKTLFS